MSFSPNEVYSRCLVGVHGYPLWTPQLKAELPEDYQLEGLKIGDVGVVSPMDGSFDILFNITLPRNKQPHPRLVRESFAPIRLDQEDFATQHDAVPPHDVISSASMELKSKQVHTYHDQTPSKADYEFSLSAGRGAVLILPEGAQSRDLQNEKSFLDEVIRHAVDWYECATEEGGRIINNDTLYLITGFHKAHSWSLGAALGRSGLSLQKRRPTSAKFKVGQIQEARVTAAAYNWEATHGFRGRVGPMHPYIIPNAVLNGMVRSVVPNQTVFIRGFRITVNRMLFLKTVSVKTREHTRSKFIGFGSKLIGRSSSGPSGSTPSSTTQGSTDNTVDQDFSMYHYRLNMNTHVTVHRMPEVSQTFHPGDSINQCMLRKEPHAMVAVTHDSLWIEMLQMGLLGVADFSRGKRLQKVLSKHYQMVVEDGVVYLRRGRTFESHPRERFSTTNWTHTTSKNSFVSRTGDGNREMIITGVKATHVALGLRRIPAGFYTVVYHSDLIWKTQVKRSAVGGGTVEWHEKIPIPSDLSVTICLEIYASFEFQPMLGAGERLRKLTITVEQLLDQGNKNIPFTFSPNDGDVVSPCSSILFTIGQRQDERSDPSTSMLLRPHYSTKSENMVDDATNRGHSALSRYQKHGEKRVLEHSIEEFGHALSICPANDPRRAAAQSNLARAKLMLCQVEGASASLDTPLSLYRSALATRPIGHDDRPSTLIQLAIVHLVRFEKRRDEVERAQAEALLREVIGLGFAESHENQAANFLLETHAVHRVGPVQVDDHPPIKQDLTSPTMDELWNLSIQLLGRFEQFGDVAELHQTVRILKKLVMSTSVWDNGYRARLANLAVTLWYRFHHLGGLRDLEDAISSYREVLELTPDGDPDKPIYLNNLSNSFIIRFECLGRLGDLEDAISRYRKAVDLTPRGHPDKPAHLNNLGNSLFTRFERLRELHDFEEAVSVLKSAVDLTPRGHPYKSVRLNNLGNCFESRFERLGKLGDLENAISTYKQAIALNPEDQPPKHIYLNNLGNSLLTRFERLGELHDLEEAIPVLKNAINFTPRADPHRSICLNNLGRSLFMRFEQLGELHDLEEAVPVLKKAIGLTPRGHAHESVRLNNLGNSLFARFESLGELHDLEEAVSVLKDAVDITSRNHPFKPIRLNNLGNCFVARFGRLGELGDLEDAISMHKEAIELIPSGHPNKSIFLNDLGNCFITRFERFGKLGDLENAISVYKEAIKLTAHGHPHKPIYLNNLSNSLVTRFEHLGGLVDLEDAISRYKEAIDLTPCGHPDKPARLNNLGNSLFAHFERLGELGDLAEAVSVLANAVDLTPRGHPYKSVRLSNLGNCFVTRFERLGELSDLENAISTYKEAIELTAHGHPHKPVYLNNLSNSFATRFERLGKLGDLEDAILSYREAIDLTPYSHPDKPARLNNLGNSLFTRFERLGELQDLEEAVSALKNAVNLTPRDHPHRSVRLNNLGNCFATRFERLGELSDLENAISTLKEAAALSPHDHPHKPSRLNNLGNSLKARFERLGELHDLEDAISTLKGAVDLLPSGHPQKPACLSNLGNSLATRFEHLWELSDLEDAISALGKAVDLIPDGHPHKSTCLDSLGDTLITRFEHLGDLADLEDAISRYQEAVGLTFHGQPDKLIRLSNLGNSRFIRFQCLGELTDLQFTISTLREVANHTPHGHSNRSNYLNNLGNSLNARFERLGKLDDLEDAISTFTDAVVCTPHSHPTKMVHLNNLGKSFLTRFERLGDSRDLENAISMLSRAVELTSHGHRHSAALLSDLGDSYLTRFEYLGESGDLEDAISLYSHAASNPISPTSVRLHASQKWISCSRRIHHHSLLHAYSVAIALLPRRAWMGLASAHHLHEPKRGFDMVHEAAAAALESGLPETAVEWLETGYSTAWEEFYHLHSPYKGLLSTYPDHAHRLRELFAALEHTGPTHRRSSPPCLVRTLEQEALSHRALAAERDILLQTIRGLPGFERFLCQKSFPEIRASVVPGPVVILNAAEGRCDAIIIPVAVDHVIHVPLPNLSFECVARLKNVMKNLLRDVHAAHVHEESQTVTWDDVGWESLLSKLWECVVKPVLDALAFSTPGDLSRIFWWPTGPFAFLPIHAAGIYGTHGPLPGQILSDFVISSYVPTLGVLASPPDSVLAPSDDLRLLVVRQPDGLPPLTGAATELEHIRAVIRSSPSSQTILLEPSVCTVEEVVALLKEADWAHFACHAAQDVGGGGFCLTDGRHLKLNDIIALSRPRGGLAYLSAVPTTVSDEHLFGKTIQFAAGLLFAGYGGVIGTMWSVPDGHAPVVARDVYEQLLRDGGPDYRDAAQALHEAIRRLRDRTTSFAEWVPFIHLGL